MPHILAHETKTTTCVQPGMGHTHILNHSCICMKLHEVAGSIICFLKNMDSRMLKKTWKCTSLALFSNSK